jgi:hypothetical protein
MTVELLDSTDVNGEDRAKLSTVAASASPAMAAIIAKLRVAFLLT